jgi:hypothetical protein
MRRRLPCLGRLIFHRVQGCLSFGDISPETSKLSGRCTILACSRLVRMLAMVRGTTTTFARSSPPICHVAVSSGRRPRGPPGSHRCPPAPISRGRRDKADARTSRRTALRVWPCDLGCAGATRPRAGIYAQLVLDTTTRQEAAIALYQGHGFVQTGRTTVAGMATLLFAKHLDSCKSY